MAQEAKRKVVRKARTSVPKKKVISKRLAAPKKPAHRTIVHTVPKKPGTKKTILSTLLGVVLLGGAGFGINEVTYYDRHVDTEDAHIDAEI
ncbi:MAG: hypothetical protein ABI778_09375, partial [Ignavibacteriota bacterium]